MQMKTLAGNVEECCWSQGWPRPLLRTEDEGGWSRQEAGAGAACERMCARVRELAGHVSPGDRDVWLSQPASQGAPGCQLTTARSQYERESSQSDE